MKMPLFGSPALRRLAPIAAVLIALVLPGTVASAAGPTGIRVFTGDNPHFLLYTWARCSVKGGVFEARTPQQRGGWQLWVTIHHFNGFHSYKLVRGRYNGTYMLVEPPGSASEYASDFVPPYHIPSGGQINFADHGKLMGGGFYPMFNEDGSDALGVAGVLACHYPKPKRR